MLKRLSYLLLLLFLAILAVPLRASPAIGAVVQTWNYDPVANIVTLKILNTSHKDITAFNIAIKETYANGHVDQHEMLEDLIGKILRAKEIQGDHSRGAEAFRKMYGDGGFHPGEVWDEKLPVQPGLTDYQAVIDVVTYIDGTADAANNDALGRIVEERQATVASQKIIIETIQTALADPNDSAPSATAAKTMQDRAKTWKAHHTKLDLDTVRLESMADELKAVSSRDALKEIVKTEGDRLSALSVHATPVKTGGQP